MSCRKKSSTIAVIGGGIAGSTCASELSKHFENVIVFDQGRRGPGGRASHRSVNATDGIVLPDDDTLEPSNRGTFEFDHGCQFFRADSALMQTELLPQWLSSGWAAPWEARLGCLPVSNDNKREVDFFGIPTRKEKVYVGVGGMHQLPRHILESSDVEVQRGTRISGIRKNENDRWALIGVNGSRAFHDTPEEEAKKATPTILCTADAVVFTDISSSSDSWHRASAGVPESLRLKVPKRARIPLFSCMVALSYPIREMVPYDGFSVSDNPKMWFACLSQSKPGFPECHSECWTLVSTPSFAVEQIRETTMRDPLTGSFRPQENSYLNTVPGPALFKAFLQVVKPYLKNSEPPKAVYLQAQRWGSGLPAPDFTSKGVQEICGTIYATELENSLVYPRPSNVKDSDFIAEGNLRLYYAGDFCSQRNPGFESAALSGLDVAKHIASTIFE